MDNPCQYLVLGLFVLAEALTIILALRGCVIALSAVLVGNFYSTPSRLLTLLEVGRLSDSKTRTEYCVLTLIT